MASLPAIDLGIMAEHLSAHEGIINKLNVYHEKATNIELKEIIAFQGNMMRIHVKVMLALINPHYNDYVEVPDLSVYSGNGYYQRDNKHWVDYDNKWIALEAHSTAKLMSNENYISAIMMKDKNARNAHVEMALQQLEAQKRYSEFINRMGWTFVPHVSVQDQVNTYQHFQHMLNQ
ncbi:hypothetical protein F9U64_01655 [Gracilibacillus oryzae]|uniref:Uncharacterized protein n=1 Tax=Gracilibacillus oryzae TaxID=1672701 RepID=A0A7C8KUF8_9BACI|nr:hypothetical protein [Gracilibacillus oryzae]KAB8139207.1 hypothetical protein F9U64_01655 [Gracilibacillus oryzae]